MFADAINVYKSHKSTTEQGNYCKQQCWPYCVRYETLRVKLKSLPIYCNIAKIAQVWPVIYAIATSKQ